MRVLADNLEPSQSYLLQRGDPVGFGDPVEPGVPGVLQNAALKPYAPVPPFAGTSGRRLALANWLTQPNHPLTARVMVNQMWLRHFGRGIVPSVSNFGRSGVPPTHPELLDWLATEFVAQGWSMKSMHRLMLTSQAYRQTSRVDEALVAADPENALLSRMPLQRMDAETLYDSLMAVAGRLDSTLFGPPSEVEVRPDKEVVVKADSGRLPPQHLCAAPTADAGVAAGRLRPACDDAQLHRAPPLQRGHAGAPHDERIDDVGPGALHGGPRNRRGRSRQHETDRGDLSARLFAAVRRPTEIAEGLSAIAEFRKEWPARLAKDNGEAPREAGAALAGAGQLLPRSAEFGGIQFYRLRIRTYGKPNAPRFLFEHGGRAARHRAGDSAGRRPVQRAQAAPGERTARSTT